MARGAQLSNKTVLIWLGVFIIAALALRIGGNVGASFDEESGRYLYSGNDPYYHDRAVNHILETGESLSFDPAINYPDGASNPNPPFFDWTTAMDAAILETFGVGDAAGVALNLAVAFWGAITVIPVYMIGAELFGRRAGLWSAFFIAVSAPHIQRGVWGFADHDATTMFFITLSLAFMIKGLRSLDDREYVANWRHRNALVSGLKASFAHNKQAMLWSALAGTALSATALTWKGYPYVLAVLAVAVGIQLLTDHVRNKDSTALWAFYMLPLVMVSLIPLIHYALFPEFLDTTIFAGLYVLIGVLVVGAILVPTRDLPSILVFPALLVAGIVGLLVMLFVFPEVGRTVFTGLGYFQQSKLYTTIAEAQRSELGRIAASFGFFAFLIAFVGLYRVLKATWKGDAPRTLMFAWAAVALFMAFAASRFVMNAAPVFAILAGAIMPDITAMLKLRDVKKRFAQQHGQNQVKAGVRSLNGRVIGGGLLVFFLFVFPNLWIGVDAALPCEVDHCNPQDPDHIDQLGAFGIDFDVKDNGWLSAFHHLAQLDQDQPLEDRPGFIAWWDYGHWATNLGKHPTVADPFQNHFNLAGRFLASESEQEGMAWLTILLLNADWGDDEAFSPAVASVVAAHPGLEGVGTAKGYGNDMRALESAVDLSTDEIFAVYDDVSDASETTVGYFAVDRRMYPFDAVNAPGIFYAPSFLADKNPDDFLDYKYQGQGLNLDVQQYAVDEKGHSYRLSETKVVDANGNKYTVQPTGAGTGIAYRGSTIPAGQAAAGGTNVQFTLTPTQAFFDSMYAKAFGHAQNGFTAGEGLSHWRVIHQSEGQAVDLLEYYRGVQVTGTIRDDAGNGVAGVDVTFRDGFGAGHAKATTGADGTYTVLAPFSSNDDLVLEASIGGVALANSTAYQFTRDQAMAGHSQSGADLSIQRSDVTGTAFHDANGDGSYDAANETAIAGATVTVAGRTTTTGADGRYSIAGVQPGVQTLTISADGFNNATQTLRLDGTADDRTVAMTAKSSTVTFSLGDNNEKFATIPFTVTGANGFTRQLTTNAEGSATTTLAPGSYEIDLSYQVTQDGQSVSYTANWTGGVPFGGDPVTFNVFVTKA